MKVVTDTAQIRCDKGSAPTSLSVTSQDFSCFDGKLIATEEDAVPNENVMPFGSCKVRYYMACKPATQKWDKTSAKDTINDMKIVLEDSVCLCKLGGTITIESVGHGGHIEAE